MAMVTETPSIISESAAPLRAGASLTSDAYQQIRRTMLLDGCKWDPQVGDVETISRFPLLLSREHWQSISEASRSLSLELLAAEEELIRRPDLHATLGLPRRFRSIWNAQSPHAGRLPRVLRFDFHWTGNGWRISEVNSDVPGGFSEASFLTKLMASYYPGHTTAGDPAAAWADAIAAAAQPAGTVALLAAAGFMEDQQVVAFMERSLVERGVRTFRTTPDQLTWANGFAGLHEPLGAIVRFYQAEWLDPRRDRPLLADSRTPVMSPGSAILTESKRFPLTWDALSTKLPTWRRLLPETRNPREIRWQQDESWILKSAYCNNGDTVGMRSRMTERQWGRLKRAVWLHPRGWIAQRRFDVEPVASDSGPVYPCIGVFTLNSEPIGIYGRFSRSPIVDFAAVDTAVLIEDHPEFTQVP
jgi:glutathionylspermidine synthase